MTKKDCKQTEEHNEKIRQTNIEKKYSIEKYPNYGMRGKHHSEKGKNNISKGCKGIKKIN